MSNKDLIVISAYCPTESKERKLSELVDRVQDLRNLFDILVVSHSPISKEIQNKIDHFYYDSNNDLLEDFDLRYLGWYETESFFIESSLVYNHSTCVAIARSNRYSINFANFWGYKKVHYIEYDFLYIDDNFILNNNKYLDEYDTVMLRHPNQDGLVASSVYYCFNTKGLNEESSYFDRDKFVELVRNSGHSKLDLGGNIWMTNHARMTENLNVILFSQNNRTIKFLDSFTQDQTEDSHNNDEMKWVLPIYDETQNSLMIFIRNTLDTIFRTQILINDQDSILFECHPGYWKLDYLCDFEGDKEIKIVSEGKILKHIKINDSNREKFIKNSFIKYK